MKKKIITLVLVLALVLSFGLVACGGDDEGGQTGAFREAMAFGDVHWNELGAITVKVNADDKIVDVIIDGVFLPYTWSIPAADEIAAYTTTVKEAHTVKADAPNTTGGTGSNLTSSNKFIRIGNRYFEAQTDVTLNRGSRTAVEYKEIGGSITGLHAYILDESKQAQAQWFWEAAMNGDCYVVMEKDATKTNLSERFADVCQAYGNTANGRSITKRSSDYWTPAQGGLGLKTNMAKLENWLRLEGEATYTKAQIVATVTEGEQVKVGDVEIGATASDAPAYLMVAKKAWELAKAK